MADEQNPPTDAEVEDEFEEISGEEVENVLQVLDALMERVDSDNIRACLEEASNAIFYLVYDDNDLDASSAEAA